MYDRVEVGTILQRFLSIFTSFTADILLEMLLGHIFSGLKEIGDLKRRL